MPKLPAALALSAALLLAACAPQSADAPPAQTSAVPAEATIRLATARGEVALAPNPAPIAVYDLASLDTLTALGVPVAGSPKKVYLPYLQTATQQTTDVGTFFEPDLEALNALHPRLIIISARTAAKYDALAALAPTIDVSDSGQDLIGDGLRLLDGYGRLFGKEASARTLHDDVQTRLTAARAAAQGKGNGLILMVNAGKLSAFGPQSRFGWLHKDIGIPPADPAIQTSPHGQPVSFEYIQKMNPDWLFVLDRGAAIGAEGKAAQAVLDNALVRQTKAWQRGQVYYLSAASYVAAGGVQQMREDLASLQAALAASPAAAPQ